MAGRKKTAGTPKKSPKKTTKKATKKSSRKSAPLRVEAQIGLDAIAVEGGLLSPSWLSRIAQAGAPSQTEADYTVPKGLTLRDEIGRYWRIAQAHWAEFVQGRAGEADVDALARRLVLGLLRQCFGFGSIEAVEPRALEDRTYPIGHAALAGRVPIVIARAGFGLDTPDLAFGEDKRRRSPFGLVQEYLNADDAALWGLVCDGVTLRVVRDNASLTRPAWIEVDLARIFTEDLHAEFAALWLLIHETRFGRPGTPVSECALEAWRNAGLEEGTRARDFLRGGVEEALLALGRGFLAHPENRALRTVIQDGTLTTREYFNQLLRLVYRVIFLLTIEERGLLHADADEQAKVLYAQGYSLKRLRDRAVRRSAHDRFSDVWESVKIVFRGLVAGEPRLGLPALAGLFAAKQCPDLDAAKLENHVVMHAMFKLSWLRQDGAIARVNWRDMGPEELGSVYESLLELVPRISKDGREFGWGQSAESKGNARKTSGSYYTPDSLVQVLLDSALEPVIADTLARNPERQVEALLELSIVDPACGSGHFLLGATRRLAGHVARLQANGTPSPEDYRHAVRQVVGRCIYGVDLNPLAVELCKVSLWMEAVDPGMPLTFLDSHIQQGNSLLGTTPELMAKGIPDEAWEPIEGDDKDIASILKRRNKKAAAQSQGHLETLWSPTETAQSTLARKVAQIEEMSDIDAIAVRAKETRWADHLASDEYREQRLRADVWCVAFVWHKDSDLAAGDHAPTNELWWKIRAGGEIPIRTKEEAAKAQAEYSFFHWHLQFPQVMLQGGFDAIIGNPPWEQLQLDPREFFAQHHPEIATAKHLAARTAAIAVLAKSTDPAEQLLYSEYASAMRKNSGVRHFVHTCGRFPETTTGRLNTAPLFTEMASHTIRDRGYAALVVPSGLTTDSFTQRFFSTLVKTARLHAIFGFENEDRIFPGVDHRVNFCILVIGGTARTCEQVSVASYVRSPRDLQNRERLVKLSRQDFILFNPNSGTCPTFRTQRDYSINRKLYDRGVLAHDGHPNGNPWQFRGLLMFMMNTDSGLFREREELVGEDRGLTCHDASGVAYAPLYEAKMISSYNHRYGDFSLLAEGAREHILPPVPDDDLAKADYFTSPRYWVPHSEIAERLRGVWERGWFLGWRDVTDARSSVRTVVATIIPRFGAGHTVPLFLTNATAEKVCGLLANLCSFVLDYATRQKLGGTHLTYTYIKQLPILPPSIMETQPQWLNCPIKEWICRRVLELVYTAWDLEAFALELGHSAPPFRWNAERRFVMRCELDAAFFHLYNVSHDDADYVMETFPIVRKNDEKNFDRYRTKHVILEIYDAMAEAARTGKVYQTRLDPPPGDTHRDSTVVPFRAQPSQRPLPEWDDDRIFEEIAARVQLALGPENWATSLSGQHLGMLALASVLRNLPGPRAREDVERAVVLTILPQLMLPYFRSASARQQWTTIIGAENLSRSSVSTFEIPWRTVLRRAGQEQVLLLRSDGLWQAGVNIADAPSPVLDARALVVLAWLATAPEKDHEVTRQMGVLDDVA